MRTFGPKSADHPSVGWLCPYCKKPFKAGDFTTLISLYPADADEAEKMLAGKSYNAEAAEIHATCAESMAEDMTGVD